MSHLIVKMANYIDFEKLWTTAKQISELLKRDLLDASQVEHIFETCATDLLPCLLAAHDVSTRYLRVSCHENVRKDAISALKLTAVCLFKLALSTEEQIAISTRFRIACDVCCLLFALEEMKQVSELPLLQALLELCVVSLEVWDPDADGASENQEFCISLDCVVEFLCQTTETRDRQDVFLRFVRSDHDNKENQFLRLKNLLFFTLDRCSDRTATKILLELFERLMDTGESIDQNHQRRDWGIQIWNIVSSSHLDLARAFTILGCTANYIFIENQEGQAADGGFGHPVWMCDRFWSMIQTGLVDDNPLQRKRSLYFLKRAFDCLQSNHSLQSSSFILGGPFGHSDIKLVSKKFEDMMLILESLEEKQVHILKPLFPLIRNLKPVPVGSKPSAPKGNDTSWILPIPWLIVVYQKMLKHDSKTIRIWAIEEICSLNFSATPLNGQEFFSFFCTDFLVALNDNSLYTRLEDKPIGSCSHIGNKLTALFQSIHDSSPASETRALFFSRLICSIRDHKWCELPLLEIFRAFHLLTASSLWGLDTIQHLKDILINCLRTHDVFLRGAVQVFILKSLINLLDVKEVTFQDLSHVLVLFKRDECLKRGTELWAACTTWICSMLTREESFGVNKIAASQFINSSINILLSEASSSSESHTDSLEILCTARMVALLVDANVFAEVDGLRLALNHLAEILQSCHARPYMSLEQPECCLSFLLALSAEATSIKCDQHTAHFQHILFSFWEEILPSVMPFVEQQLFQTEKAILDLQVYFQFLEYLSQVMMPLRPQLQVQLLQTCEKSLTIFATTTASADHRGRHIAAKCFGILCSSAERSSSRIAKVHHIETFIKLAAGDMEISSAGKRTPQVPLSFADATHGHNHNRASSEFTTIIWDCVAIYLRDQTTSHNFDYYVDCGLHALEIGGHACLRPVFNSFQIILPQLVTYNPEKVVEVLAISWKSIFEMKPNVMFWDALNAFMDATFQSSLMSNQYLFPHLTQYVTRIREQSESLHGLFLPLVKKVCGLWRSDPASLPSALIGVQLLVEALTFGHIHRRDVRIMRDAAAFVSLLGDRCSVNQLLESNHMYDVQVRVEAITLLLELGRNVCVQPILEPLIRLLLKHERGVTATRSRHFANSLIHRVKQRVWQAVLLLEPLCEQDLDNWILGNVYRQLIEEGLQPSVRYQMEWLAVRIMFRYEQLRSSLWEAFKDAAKNRVGSLGSFLSIVCHLGCVLTERADQVDLIKKAIPVVLPWCMAQNFNTRVYAQVALHKLWKFCKAEHLNEITNVYAAVECLILANTESGGSARGVGKLLEEYYFYGFHPVNHYSIEVSSGEKTIFHDFPRFSGVSEEEWIHPKIFASREPFQSLSASVIPLLNADDFLSRCAVGSWTLRTKDQSADSQECVKDVQRKTTPWKQMIPDFQTMALSSESVSVKKRSNVDGLIVVASLIDKAPNLGGLCRTCEVFGVTRYVLGSLRYTEDQQFRNLSVSAENWVEIEEVKPGDIRDYLLLMKKAGYTILGAEQTLNSCKLNNCKFPKKTVLLLGNEKEGIPVELIQLLDVCVEIPQQGLIRSLNVHVTGAILIWEYARQHSLESPS